MAWGEDEAIDPDVASAGLHVSEWIGHDAAAQPDLEARATRLTPIPRTQEKPDAPKDGVRKSDVYKTKFGPVQYERVIYRMAEVSSCQLSLGYFEDSDLNTTCQGILFQSNALNKEKGKEAEKHSARSCFDEDGYCSSPRTSGFNEDTAFSLQHTSSRQQLHIQAEVEAEAMSSFRIDDDLRVNPDLNQFSSNLHGLASSSTRVEIGGHDRTPASSEQRAESHGRKRKQSQIAGVLEEYLDYKRQHNDKLLDVMSTKPLVSWPYLFYASVSSQNASQKATF
ncbi:hypothetical protein Zm00014a_041794 [Zea mays]|uniref:Uncharacterized protein n=1 Tax=Zea mays TaxID=4577 RepID=A0A317YH28_MAIZE|nr:hypothetical protein Zm00014a_041794 [Zea mays]